MLVAGHTTVVTGASSGIGAATAREVARRGGNVVLGARRVDLLGELADALNVQRPGCALEVPTDVAKPAEIERLIQAAVARYGRVDALVNNAGVSGGGPLATCDDATLDRMAEVNLLAPARAARAVIPHLRRHGGGVIVNVGSIMGEVAIAGFYPATKFGLRGLSDGLRRELGRDHVAVVLVEPGLIRTAMTVGSRVPMPGPEVVARVIADAIERPPRGPLGRRAIIVPWPYVPLVYGAKALPWLLDGLSGRQLLRRLRRIVTRRA